MARETFIDTSGFYALLVKRDDMHEMAARVLDKAAKQRARFVTTDYVLDETVTLLCARGHAHLVAPFLESTLKSQACTIDWMNPDRFAQAAAILKVCRKLDLLTGIGATSAIAGSHVGAMPLRLRRSDRNKWMLLLSSFDVRAILS